MSANRSVKRADRYRPPLDTVGKWLASLFRTHVTIADKSTEGAPVRTRACGLDPGGKWLASLFRALGPQVLTAGSVSVGAT